MRKFKRLIRLIVLTTLENVIAISLGISAMEMLVWKKVYEYLGAFSEAITLIFAVALIERLAVPIVMPLDFCYSIKAEKDYIIFEMSENDWRKINKTFNIYEKTCKHIVLDDGISRIIAADNKEVSEYLNEIQN